MSDLVTDRSMASSDASRTPTTASMWVIRIALALMVLAIYRPAFDFGYVRFDDPEYVTKNRFVQQGLSVEGVSWAFTARHAANWHPVTWLSLMLDTTLLGNNARGHHAMNIALHAVNVLLLLGILTRLTGAPWRSALVAALFASHPLHVESVAWISERKDVLSLLFWLLAIRAYVKFASHRTLINYLLTSLWMAMSLMAKPMAVTLPAIFLLLDFWPLNRFASAAFTVAWFKRGVSLTIEKLPLLALSIASAITTVWAQLAHGVVMEGRLLSIVERLQNVSIAYAMYLGKLFRPVDLSCLYPNPLHLGDFAWPLWQPLAAGAMLVALTVIGVVLDRRAPFVLFGWLWYLIAMIPVIGFVQIGRQITADRYAYIPFIGLYIIIVWTLGSVSAAMRRQVATAMVAMCAAAVILTLAVIAHRQVWVWRDDVTLFSHAVAVTDRNWLMHNNLAGVLELAGRIDEAEPHMRIATEICADCAWIHEAYGELLYRTGAHYQAQLALERALQLDPNHAPSHSMLGLVFIERSMISQGVTHLQKAVDLQPTHGEYRMRLAVGLDRAGRRSEAVEQMNEAIKLWPHKRTEWQPLIDSMTAKPTFQ